MSSDLSTRTPAEEGSTAAPPQRRRPSPPGRRVRIAVGSLAVLVVVGAVIAAVLVFLLSNAPLRERLTDRTQPAVLTALEDLSEYHAATGQYQVIVDLERTRNNVPRILSGERTLFVAFGEVDAVTDFSGLGGNAVRVTGDRVRIVLPHAELSEPVVDPERSYVANRERGVLDRLGGIFSDEPTSERELVLAAEERLMEAAAEGDLVERAEENTEAMLRGLMSSLGFTDTTVVFR